MIKVKMIGVKVKYLFIVCCLLLLAEAAFAHQIDVKLLGQCAPRHCDDNLIVVGKKAGSEEKPKCIYRVEEECNPPLICEHAQCVEPTVSSLEILAPAENFVYSRNEQVRLLFDVQHQPEGSHIDIDLDGVVRHNIISPYSLGTPGSGKHALSVSVVSRDHRTLQRLQKAVSFSVSPSSITGPTIFVPLQQIFHTPDAKISFIVYNMPSSMHVDAFLNGELVKHWAESPFSVYLLKGKNTLKFQLAYKDETLDKTRKELQIEYVPDQCMYIECNSPPAACYKKQGTCADGNCSYSPLSYGAVCSLTKACDGKGACSIMREKPSFSTSVANPFPEERKGKLFIALEKKKNGVWREVYSIDPKRITIPQYSYFDIASFWNEKAEYSFSEAGEYRLFVQFDALQKYKEFTVKEK